jgi:hypothetical protein
LLLAVEEHRATRPRVVEPRAAVLLTMEEEEGAARHTVPAQ